MPGSHALLFRLLCKLRRLCKPESYGGPSTHRTAGKMTGNGTGCYAGHMVNTRRSAVLVAMGSIHSIKSSYEGLTTSVTGIRICVASLRRCPVVAIVVALCSNCSKRRSQFLTSFVGVHIA
jgi:hypothetical protein